MRTILLTVCLVIFSLLTYGQITPFRYNTEKIIDTKYLYDNQAKLQVKTALQKVVNDSIKSFLDNKVKKGHIKFKDALNYLSGYFFQRDILYKALSDTLKNYAQRHEKTIIETSSASEKQILDEFTTNPYDIDELKVKLQGIENKKKDDLQNCYRIRNLSKEFIYKYRTSSKLVPFPVWNSVDAQLFYNSRVNDKKAQFLKNTYLAISTDSIIPSLYSEIYSDYWGPIRAGVGLLISTGTGKKLVDSLGNIIKDSTLMQKNAIQRLENNGGNISFNLSYPILGFLSRDESFGSNVTIVPRVAMDVPYLGTDKKDYSINANVGGELTAYYTGALKVMTFYTAARVGFVFGNSKFYDYINKLDGKPFWFNQVTLGCAINSSLRIAWNYFWGDKFVTVNFPSTVSLSLVLN